MRMPFQQALNNIMDSPSVAKWMQDWSKKMGGIFSEGFFNTFNDYSSDLEPIRLPIEDLIVVSSAGGSVGSGLQLPDFKDQLRNDIVMELTGFTPGKTSIEGYDKNIHLWFRWFRFAVARFHRSVDE